MLIKGNMTLEYLVRNKILTQGLYDLLTSYSIKTLDEALSLTEWASFPEKQFDELDRIKSIIEESITILKDSTIDELLLRKLISKHLYNHFVTLGFSSFSQVYHHIKTNGGNSRILLKQHKIGSKYLAEINNIISSVKNSKRLEGKEYTNGNLNRDV